MEFYGCGIEETATEYALHEVAPCTKACTDMESMVKAVVRPQVAWFLVVVFVPESVMTETVANTENPRSLLEVEHEVEVVVEYLFTKRRGVPYIGIASFVASCEHQRLAKEGNANLAYPPGHCSLSFHIGKVALVKVEAGLNVKVCFIIVESALIGS